MHITLGLLLALASGMVCAQPVAELDIGTTTLSLAPFTRYYHDTSGKVDVDTAIRRLEEGRFHALPAGSTAFGFQTGAFWFHVRVTNRNVDESRWLLVQQYPLSDRIDVHARYRDGRQVHQASGDTFPFHSRSIRYRQPNFLVALPTNEPVDLYVRVESQSSMQVPLTLYAPSAFTETSLDAQLVIGLYYGILLALFFYNLVLWLTLRDASYFWYLFHLTAFGLVLFTLNGLGFEYLWPNSVWLADISVPLSICLSQIGMQQFTRSFLGMRQRWRLGDRVCLALIAFFILLGIASLSLPYRIATPLASKAVFLSVGWIAVASIVAVRRGYQPARIFLLAWATFLIGTAMFAAVAFGVLPKTFITEYGVQIGSALEMLLLSVALGYRYAALRNENERIVRQAKEQLEQKVEQRTTELRNALGQLGDAHSRLRESSQRDALTGLHTRAHFRERFMPLLATARDSGQPLSLLMVDLDHFKLINDRHGHLAGDDCLRWAARVVGQALRRHDALLARFGGEEFISALPGLNLAQAAAVAEGIRQQLRETPCEANGIRIPLSASIGVHQIDTRVVDNIEAALQVADEALYRAKADGRDCVRTSPPLPA